VILHIFSQFLPDALDRVFDWTDSAQPCALAFLLHCLASPVRLPRDHQRSVCEVVRTLIIDQAAEGIVLEKVLWCFHKFMECYPDAARELVARELLDALCGFLALGIGDPPLVPALHCLGAVFSMVGPDAADLVELPMDRLIEIAPSPLRGDVLQLMEAVTGNCVGIARLFVERRLLDALAPFDEYGSDEKALAVRVLGHLCALRDGRLLATVFASALMPAALAILSEFESELIRAFLEEMLAAVGFARGNGTGALWEAARQACALVEWDWLCALEDERIEELAAAFAACLLGTDFEDAPGHATRIANTSDDCTFAYKFEKWSDGHVI
jgi:hypothetical protein